MDEHLYVAFAKFEENQKEVSKLHSVTLQNSLEKDYFLCTSSSFLFSYSLIVGKNVFKIQKHHFSKKTAYIC